MALIQLQQLNVEIDDKPILHDFTLTINKGEIHALMGPNGTGKSTLSRTILGDNNYLVTSGDILFEDKSILNLTTDKRAKLGIFVAFQYPTAIEGLTNAELLRTSLNEDIGLYDFIVKLDSKVEELKMDKDMIHRSVNLGFSGGERKKNEVLQMKMLEPKFIILDEIDSGLDVDSLKIVGENIMDYYNTNKDTAILIITHYPRLLEYIKPKFVHVMKDGKIVKTGGFELAKEIEQKGYNNAKSFIMKENDKNE